MKKTLIKISFTLLLGTCVFAQEKEIDAAVSAIESNNTAAAKSELAKVSGQIDSNKISPQAKAKYYYVAGKLALNSGNTNDAAKYFGELSKYENGVMYSAKNKSSKETEYYATKPEADAAVAKGDYSKVKEETLTPKYLPTVQEDLKTLAEKAIEEGNKAYQANDNSLAGQKFYEAANLVKVLGGDTGLFKYNAALSYHKGEDYTKAFDIYKELINDGYTGEGSSWTGTDKDGNEVALNSKEDAETQKKLGLITNYKEEKKPSIEREIYSNALKALSGTKNYDEIVEQISDKYPNDTEIQTLIGNIFHNSGNEDKFLEKLIENSKLEPNNATNFYNIGVIYMNQNKDEEAIQNFEKAIAIDPELKIAYNNIVLTKIKPEKEYVEIINNNLGNSAEEKALYKEYSQKRKDLYIQVIPYLEKIFELDKSNYEAAKSLRQAYQAAEMFDKEDQMRAIEKSLQGK